MVKFFKYLIFLFTITSCEKMFYKPVDNVIPFDSPKLFIDARVIEGDSLIVLAGVSTPILNEDNSPILDSNTTVKLFENDKLVSVLDPGPQLSIYSGNFSTPFVPSAGNTYRIEASRKGYETAYGEEFLKEPPKISNVLVDSSGELLTVSFNIEDDPNTKDYYRLTSEQSFTSNINDIYFLSNGVLLGGNNMVRGVDGFLHDSNLSESKGVVKIRFDKRWSSYHIKIYRVSELYFSHTKAKTVQYNQQLEPELAFLSAPVQLHSNITNGYGLVACASKVEIKLN